MLYIVFNVCIFTEYTVNQNQNDFYCQVDFHIQQIFAGVFGADLNMIIIIITIIIIIIINIIIIIIIKILV